MASRSVVSYDDITLPYSQPETLPQTSHSTRPPPAKKRKWNAKNRNTSNSHRANNSESSSYPHKRVENNGFGGRSGYGATQLEEDTEMLAQAPGDEYEEGESRELTHEEIWDDSALVQAWEAATEEYEAHHGADKSWKKEPVKKSALWYNIPIEASKKASASSTKTPVDSAISAPILLATSDDAEDDSQPLNFDTFVPTHDPSLEINPTTADTAAHTVDYTLTAPVGAPVSQDEAFSKATSAMYWAGYWTAMYHCQRQMAQPTTAVAAGGEEEETYEEDEEEQEEDYEEDQKADGVEFVSTQR